MQDKKSLKDLEIMNQDSPYTSITQSVYAGLNLPLNIGYHVQEHLIVNLFIKRYRVLLE